VRLQASRCDAGCAAGRLAGRESLVFPGGADPTAAGERYIAALFRAATSGQRSTATVNGRGPGMPSRQPRAMRICSHPGRAVAFIFPLSSFIFPKGWTSTSTTTTTKGSTRRWTRERRPRYSWRGEAKFDQSSCRRSASPSALRAAPSGTGYAPRRHDDRVARKIPPKLRLPLCPKGKPPDEMEIIRPDPADDSPLHRDDATSESTGLVVTRVALQVFRDREEKNESPLRGLAVFLMRAEARAPFCIARGYGPQAKRLHPRGRFGSTANNLGRVLLMFPGFMEP